MNAASFKYRLTFWRSIALGVLSLGLLPMLVPRPVQGAEKIALSYGIVRQSLSVDALERYVITGAVEDNLAIYARYATPEQIAQLQQVLLARIPLNAQQLSQLLDTPIGDELVRRLAVLIQVDDSSRSNTAIRSALIHAAADSNGLTILNAIRQFPSDQIEIDVPRSLNMIAELRTLIDRTNQMIAQVNQQSKLKAAASLLPVELTQANLQQHDLALKKWTV